MSRAIAEALIEIGGVGFTPQQPITFKSGILSPIYCDNRRFPFHPQAWSQVIRGFQSVLSEQQISAEVIAGIEAAGIPHSAALGFATATPSIFVRKEAKSHGAKKRVEGGDIEGKRTVLVEDLVSTGLSSLSGVEAIRTEGGLVTDCLAIISYEMADARQSFAAANVRLHTLTTFAEVLDVATERELLSATDAAVVRDWLADPHGWAARRKAS
jgi:orotate phosphoribosyltransferase